MKHRGTLVAALSMVAALLGGCARGDAGGGKRLDELTARLEEVDRRSKDIDGRLKKIEELIENATKGPPEPDPAVTYSVPVAGDPFKGVEHARVTVVEAFEFACPYCQKVHPTMDALLAKYEGKLKVVYKYFVVHEAAVVPGLAACAADRQGKYAPMEQLIWDKGFAERDLSPENMMKLAAEAKLDLARFEQDMQGSECQTWLQQSQAQLQAVGTAGTPAFYINGRFLSGAQPIENFARLIDEELAKADQAIAGGVPVERYYQTAVVEAGQKSL